MGLARIARLTSGAAHSRKGMVKSAALVALVLGAYWLRLLQIESQSIWTDEGISLHLATSPMAEILADRAGNFHPPLYFMLLKLWLSLSGVGPFTGRYLSALMSLLYVPTLYAVSRRWFGRSTAWVAAVLGLISPLSVVYAQEIRIYALLPVIYLYLLYVTGKIVRTMPGNKRPWLILGVLEWFALHLHYTAIFAITYICSWALYSMWIRRRWKEVRRWLTVQLSVGFASLPWLLMMLVNWSRIQGRVDLGRAVSEPVPVSFLVGQLWTFPLTGLAELAERPEIQAGAGAIAMALLALFWLRLAARPTPYSTLRFAAHWIAPFCLTALLWSIRSFSHPRYIVMFSSALLAQVAYLISGGLFGAEAGRSEKWRFAKISSLVSGLGIVFLSLLSLNLYFFHPTVGKKPDMRGVARRLETITDDRDLIIVPLDEWSLAFEYAGNAPIIMPRLVNRDVYWSEIGDWVPGRRTVVALDRMSWSTDWQGIIPFTLESNGMLEGKYHFRDLVADHYLMKEEVARPTLSAVRARFLSLDLIAAWVEDAAPANSAFTMALSWQKVKEDDRRYLVSEMLADTVGWPLETDYELLLDSIGRPSDRWEVGQTVTTYHVVPIPPETPPHTYAVAIGVRTETGVGDLTGAQQSVQRDPQWTQFEVGTVVVEEPVGNAISPYQEALAQQELRQPFDGIRK